MRMCLFGQNKHVCKSSVKRGPKKQMYLGSSILDLHLTTTGSKRKKKERERDNMLALNSTTSWALLPKPSRVK